MERNNTESLNCLDQTVSRNFSSEDTASKGSPKVKYMLLETRRRGPDYEVAESSAKFSSPLYGKQNIYVINLIIWLRKFPSEVLDATWLLLVHIKCKRR